LRNIGSYSSNGFRAGPIKRRSMVENFPWWNEEQKKFATEVKQFVNGVIPRDEEARWKREFPWDIFNTIGKRGYNGAMIPKEYGGMGLGATGACIAGEEFSRMPGVGRVFIGNMLGGLGQIMAYGTEEQKRRFLPRIAKGELGAICITEPFVGTDAAATETVARRDGDKYIISGKKRFIVSAGVAVRHMLYARTSDDPQAIRRHQHLTAFIVEKGMPGFTTEKINEIIGFDDIQNGVLDLNEVPVPIDNMIGKEGEGWQVMMEGVNVERTLIAAQAVGWLRGLIEIAVPYTQRRVQFGQRTADFVNNQLKIADLFIKLRMARMACYYNAYLFDLGHDIAMGAAAVKAFNCERAAEAARDAIQIMGGDGVTPFYFPEAIHKLAKVEEISGGTMEAMRLIIYRAGLREMAEDIKMPRRVIHKELGVPITNYEKPVQQSQIDDENLLKVLAEDYRVNPGLHMSREDLIEVFNVADEELDKVLLSLEQKKLATLYRDRRGIKLAKATYEGLKKANPLEYYRWFPSWVDEKRMF
jgi:alkylation response protein AidB-like acyl-CoA dehydrogenase